MRLPRWCPGAFHQWWYLNSHGKWMIYAMENPTKVDLKWMRTGVYTPILEHRKLECSIDIVHMAHLLDLLQHLWAKHEKISTNPKDPCMEYLPTLGLF